MKRIQEIEQMKSEKDLQMKQIYDEINHKRGQIKSKIR